MLNYDHWITEVIKYNLKYCRLTLLLTVFHSQHWFMLLFIKHFHIYVLCANHAMFDYAQSIDGH